MKKLLGIFGLVLLIASCTPKIHITDGVKSRTIKIKGDITVTKTHFHFQTKKGTQQYVPLEYFTSRNDTLTVKY